MHCLAIYIKNCANFGNAFTVISNMKVKEALPFLDIVNTVEEMGAKRRQITALLHRSRLLQPLLTYYLPRAYTGGGM